MSELDEKYIGESKLLDVPVQKISLKLTENAINNVIKPLIDAKYDDILNMVNTIQESGVALSSGLGQSTVVGITQKGITDAINGLQSSIDEIKAIIRRYHNDAFGFNFSVSPTSITKGEATTVTAKLTTYQGATATQVTIYAGDDRRIHNNVSSVTETFTLSDTTTVTASAVIDGITYTKSVTVNAIETVVESTYMYFGSGLDYSDVYNADNRYDITSGIEGTYTISVEDENKYLFLLIPTGVDFDSSRLTMLFQVPITHDNIVSFGGDDTVYNVWRTGSKWRIGEYNLKIE